MIKQILISILVSAFPVSGALGSPLATIFVSGTDQFRIYEEAKKDAIKVNKLLLIILGEQTCIWGANLNKVCGESNLKNSLHEIYRVQGISLADFTPATSADPEKNNVQLVIDELKSMADMKDRIPGYPFIFVVDPIKSKAIGFRTGPLEANDESKGLYGHDLALLTAKINEANLALTNSCSSFLSASGVVQTQAQ